MIDFESLIKKGREDGISKFVVGAYIVNGSGDLLLLQRSSHEFMPDLYELPSGKVEKGESFPEALEREIEEETGLRLKTIDSYVNYFDYNNKTGARTRQYNFEVVCVSGEISLSDEHQDYMWANLDNIEDNEFIDDTTRKLVKDYFGED